ncbi:hypothetical protein [Persicobacter psychrovividus]|uniref:Uncharacterized protein n=1 Tax=Persicobacter psychrovividus TaxID=387638 RepID=A0ABM7VNA2_9BACT|nr:hypothetical protein PEPS_47340 [Persicobacter psychrovividus]
MGFNIAGLVINKNYEKDIKQLSDDLEWGIEIIEEVSFEIASSNWTPEDEFRLYFGEQGTMIFHSHDLVAEHDSSLSADTLNYAYSETAMAFQIDLFKKGQLVRSIFEHEGDRKMEEGEPLALEKENPTADELTFALIHELFGESFYEIDFAAKAFRCKKVNYTRPSNEVAEQQIIEDLEESPSPEVSMISEEDSPEVSVISEEGLKEKEFAPTTNAAPAEAQKKWWQFWK